MKKKRKKAATTAETSRGSIETTRESNEPTKEFLFVVAMTVEDTPGREARGTARRILGYCYWTERRVSHIP
jgi:hypothetical protein